MHFAAISSWRQASNSGHELRADARGPRGTIRWSRVLAAGVWPAATEHSLRAHSVERDGRLQSFQALRYQSVPPPTVTRATPAIAQGSQVSAPDAPAASLAPAAASPPPRLMPPSRRRGCGHPRTSPSLPSVGGSGRAWGRSRRTLSMLEELKSDAVRPKHVDKSKPGALTAQYLAGHSHATASGTAGPADRRDRGPPASRPMAQR